MLWFVYMNSWIRKLRIGVCILMIVILALCYWNRLPSNSTSRHLVTERAGKDWNFRVFATLICYILCSLLSLIFPPHFLVFLPSLKLWVLPLGVWRCICFTNGHRHFLTQETLEVEIFLSKLLLQIVTLEVPSLGIIILLLIHECDDSRDRIVIYIPSVCS